jgi:hypothetical protein
MPYYTENIKKFYFKEELSKKGASLTIPSVYVVIGTPSFRETRRNFRPAEMFLMFQRKR